MDEAVTGAPGAPETKRCPACGSPLPLDARSCLACGSIVVTGGEAAHATTPDLSEPAQPPEPPIWRSPGVDAETEQLTGPLGPGEQRCQWCGARSPAEADSCVQCHAAFPDPARDAAMLAEAQRRLTIIEQELDAKKRPRRFWGLLP